MEVKKIWHFSIIHLGQVHLDEIQWIKGIANAPSKNLNKLLGKDNQKDIKCALQKNTCFTETNEQIDETYTNKTITVMSTFANVNKHNTVQSGLEWLKL